MLYVDDAKDCSGNLLRISGTAVNSCFTGYSNSSNFLGSVSYTCTGYTVYSSIDCTGPVVQTVSYQYQPNTCTNLQASHSGWSKDLSRQAFCLKSATSLKSLETLYPNRIWQAFYDNDVCSYYPVQFASFPTNFDLTSTSFTGNNTYSCSDILTNQPLQKVQVYGRRYMNSTLFLNTRCSYVAPQFTSSIRMFSNTPLVYSSQIYFGCENYNNLGTSTSTEDNEKKKMSPGAAVGITIAVIIIVILLCIGCWFGFRRYKATSSSVRLSQNNVFDIDNDRVVLRGSVEPQSKY